MLNRQLLTETLEPFGISIDDETFRRLDIYAEFLIETNKQFNLTAITDLDEVTVKHFADSLSVLAFADINKGASLIDVGTGAGFPGLVLKAARPDLDVSFLDSTQKKLGFIDEALCKMGLEGETIHMRAEEAGRDPVYRENFDYATARAVASLPVLCEYCLPLVKKGGTFIAMKAAESDEEVGDAGGTIGKLGGKTKADNKFILGKDNGRRIILIRKNSPTPARYPRAAAQIKKSRI